MTTATLPPRAHGLPVLGSIVELRRSQITAYEQARRDQGDVVRFAVGPPGLRFDLYGVFHPDGVRQVLAGSRDGYAKGGRFYQKIGESFGWGLLTSEGEEWLRQRRMIQPLFTRRTVATYGDLMTHEAVGLAERWSAAGTADANADAVRLSLRIVGATIFGGDVDGAHEVLARAFPTLNAWMFRRAMSPVATPAGWPTPGNREAGRARRALYGYVDSLVARRERTGATGDDLLSRLLRARDPDSGRGLAAQEVRDQALIFLLAGHETTSTALTFTFDLLGRHPEEQDALHAELDVVLKGRAPRVADVPRLTRTAMAIKEAMRLYPPAYAVGRLVERDDEIGGFRIPAGSFLTLSPWVTHRHPAFWPDPDRYLPSRFAAETEAQRHPHAYFPFGGGARGCIGSHFAMLETVITVAAVLQRGRLVSDPVPVAVDTHGITLRPGGPAPVRLVPRAAVSGLPSTA